MTCHYPHMDPLWPGTVAKAAPTLTPVRNGRGTIIAWQCPVCLRTWQAGTGMQGRKGHELIKVDTIARRRDMMKACEEDGK
jgi:hypothetical protein